MASSNTVRTPRKASTTAAASKPATAPATAPATTVLATPAAPAVAAPAQPQATPAAVAPAPAAPHIVLSVPAHNVRTGTARAAALSCIMANIGQPVAAVVETLRTVETQWHVSQGRTPKGINPRGWLRLFNVVTGPATAATQPQVSA